MSPYEVIRAIVIVGSIAAFLLMLVGILPFIVAAIGAGVMVAWILSRRRRDAGL